MDLAFVSIFFYVGPAPPAMTDGARATFFFFFLARVFQANNTSAISLHCDACLLGCLWGPAAFGQKPSLLIELEGLWNAPLWIMRLSTSHRAGLRPWGLQSFSQHVEEIKSAGLCTADPTILWKCNLGTERPHKHRIFL